MTLSSTKYANNYRLVNGTITVQDNDCILACVTTSAAVTINLPSIPSGNWNTNWKLYVYDNSGNAATNSITLVAGTGQTINGASTLVISTNSGRVIVEISSNSSFNALSSFSAGITQAYTRIQEEGAFLTQRSILNFIGSYVTVTDNSGAGTTDVTISIPSIYYQTIYDHAVALPQRAAIDFEGNAVSLLDTVAGTIITINAYTTVQDEGVSLAQRSVIDFVGAGVTVIDSGSKTIVTIPGNVSTYFYAKKSLTTLDASFGIPPVAGGVNSVFGGQQVTEYTTKTESGLTFNSSLGEFTVPSSGLYSLNATFITRINPTNINSLINGSSDPWCSDATSQLALGIMIETGGSGTVDDIACSNKQTINNVNISDVNIDTSALPVYLTVGDVVSVYVFNKTTFTIVNLASSAGLPSPRFTFSVIKIS